MPTEFLKEQIITDNNNKIITNDNEKMLNWSTKVIYIYIYIERERERGMSIIRSS